MGDTSEGERTKGISQTLWFRAASRDESKVARDSDTLKRSDFQNTQFQFLGERPASASNFARVNKLQQFRRETFANHELTNERVQNDQLQLLLSTAESRPGHLRPIDPEGHFSRRSHDARSYGTVLSGR